MLVVGAVMAALGLVMMKQNQKASAEAQLWSEATDPLSPRERLQA